MYRTSAAHTGETAKISRMLTAAILIALAFIVLFGTGFAPGDPTQRGARRPSWLRLSLSLSEVDKRCLPAL
jgi:hypothetical protein